MISTTCRRVFVIACIFATGCQRSEEFAQPSPVESSLVATPSEIELRQVPLGSLNFFTGKIKNVSTSAVSIESIQSSCGCTGVELSKKRIEPNETVEYTGKFQAPYDSGDAKKQILIQPVDGHSLVLALHAEIVRTISWSPETLSLEPNMFSDAPSEGDFTVKNSSDTVVRLVPPKDGSNSVSVISCPGEVRPGEAAQVRVSVSSLVVTPMLVELAIQTSHLKESLLKLPIQISPVNSIFAKPRQINFGIVDVQALQRRLPLTIRLNGPLLENAKTEKVLTPQYLALLGERRENESAIDYTFGPTKMAGFSDLGGEIKIVLKHPKCEQPISVSVPISGFIK